MVGKQELTTAHTICSHAQTVMEGAALDFPYKMKSVYTHFSINVIIQGNGSLVEMRTFLGEKYICRVWMKSSIACSVSQAQKDELVLEENDMELITLSCFEIQQDTTAQNKNIGTF